MVLVPKSICSKTYHSRRMHMRITRLEFAVSRLHQCASDSSENTKNMDKYNEQLDVEINCLLEAN